MNSGYFILQPDGTRDGPYAEEELLDLMDAGDIGPGTKCLHAASGTVSEAATLFRVLAPPPDKPDPVAWKPAPLPEAAPGRDKTANSPDKPRIRRLYFGCPCVLSYWRSFLLAAILITGGVLAREKVPALLAAGLLSGMGVTLLAVLHRMRSRYLITTARVECHHGILFRASRELRIAGIRSIQVSPCGFPGIGRITFFAAAGPREDITFDRVWRATALMLLVRRLQDSPPA